MDHVDIANRAGVYLGDLDSLVKGQATANVAKRLGVTMADVEDFIRGSVSLAMTQRLGLATISAAEELSRTLGRNGAIGIVFGLLISNDH